MTGFSTKGLDLILFKLSTYTSITVVLAIIVKYLAIPAYDILLASSGAMLLACIILMGILRYRGSNHKILSDELVVRIYILSIICGVLYFVPNTMLIELGFMVKG